MPRGVGEGRLIKRLLFGKKEEEKYLIWIRVEIKFLRLNLLTYLNAMTG